MVRNDRGFTIAEVMMSILMLTVGAIGIASSTAGMTRMLARGDRATTATTYAQERLELLRAMPCDSLANGNAMRGGHYALEWTVTVTGNTRGIQLATSYYGTGVSRTDTTETSVPCV